MKYNKFKRSGIKVSEISLGAEHIENAPYEQVKRIIDIAVNAGVNYMDLFMGSPDIRDNIGKALKRRRNKMMVAGHLGAVFVDGQYKRTRDMKLVKKFYYDLLERLDTDYIDMLMIHFVDDKEDLKVCIDGGILDFACELKKKGIARMIGISTHVPAIAKEAIETGEMDGIMFSLNPLFDLMPENASIDDLFKSRELLGDGVETNSERHDLYSFCEQKNVGVIVMKTFAGGWLLKDDSPVKMSVSQCISYALSKPGVVTAACGCRSVEEYSKTLEYIDANENEKDFAEIYKSSFNWKGDAKCLYCNHCLPCPEGIDIAGAMRIIDSGGVKPDNCTGCGLCQQRCPFGVPVTKIFM